MTSLGATPEFIPGRPFHLGLAKCSTNANRTIMPSNRETLSLRRQRSRKVQPKVINVPSSPTASSSTSQHSTETSSSAFDGVENCKDHIHSSKNDIPPGTPTAPAADRRRQIQLHHIPVYHSRVFHTRPPPNAPTGPAADRRQLTKLAPVPLQVPPQAVPSHCQSKVWRSPKTELTDAFTRVQLEMQRLDFSKSPAAPATFEEYLEVVLAEKDRKIRLNAAMLQVIRLKTEQQKKARQEGGGSGHTSNREPASMQDPTSDAKPNLATANPLYGADPCWNIQYTKTTDRAQDRYAEWPTLSVYKDASRRALNNKCLPPPRQRNVQDRTHMALGDAAWEERAPVHQEHVIGLDDRRGIFSLGNDASAEADPNQHIDPKSLNDWTREIIDEIILEIEGDETTITDEDKA
ncbi:hypothetical protein CABS01_11050 [Colletotrichum abscissum]|uniref:Uncharacterized protein n=1 Tax=Colletotrichum abscissum TaxID=1671311 RepID=A0A9Q0AZX8_9PEZI|nr:uncharacterized protein CABS01_11050 [Colletotrichum abscissum]KAI3543227.1 hypothetical protein CABS02_10104 [Colletotrichum abscissum]KAK1496901.1 hypothetical protein CABS01_11050 [Colletotrichum abscissum]